MKKAIGILMAVIFVCCVMVHGKNERFSLEEMMRNLTNFQDIPSLDEVVECWTKSYYDYDASDMSEWVDWYTLQDDEDGGTIFVYKGRYPLAYEEDGTLTNRHPYEWHSVYNADGTPYINKHDPEKVVVPIIEKHLERKYYEGYAGDNVILKGLDQMRGFFTRLGRSVGILADMVVCIFDNTQYLLPWNSTVPKEV